MVPLDLYPYLYNNRVCSTEKCVSSRSGCCVNILRAQLDRPRWHGAGPSLHMLS